MKKYIVLIIAFLFSGLCLNVFAQTNNGICLYMYEYASPMSALGAGLTYAITLFWMLLNWFFLRPKQIKSKMPE